MNQHKGEETDSATYTATSFSNPNVEYKDIPVAYYVLTQQDAEYIAEKAANKIKHDNTLFLFGLIIGLILGAILL